jgi:hypothetical protein
MGKANMKYYNCKVIDLQKEHNFYSETAAKGHPIKISNKSIAAGKYF